MLQRHLRSCPRDSNGELLPHRCRGNWGYIIDAGRRPDGVRRQVHRGGFATKREAQAALRDEVARQNSGLANVQGLTVQAYLLGWLEGKRNLRATTRRNYDTHLRRYLIPSLGRLRLTELAPHHLDVLYSDLIGGKYQGASATTVHHIHRTLRSALNTAVMRRLIPWNPAMHVELPDHRRARTEVWSPQDLAHFLDGIADERFYALFHLMAFTGLRRGEAIGLHWADLDLDRKHLTVYWQVTDAGGGPKLGAPKTDSGGRVVPIDGLTAHVLKRHQVQQDEDRRMAQDGWQETGLVFTKDNGGILRPDAVTHLFARLVRATGVPPIRLHDVRHTHATLALSAGVDIKVVSNRLGHSTTSITADLYTHVVPAVARQAADAIAGMVTLSRGVSEPDVTPLLPRRSLPRTGTDPPEDVSAGHS